MSIFIGLNGDTSSGKTTAAKYLEEKGFVRYSLTMAILDYIHTHTNELDLILKNVENLTEYREAYEMIKAAKGREYFIKYGREMRAKNGDSAVSLAALPVLESLSEKWDKIVIDDLRIGDEFLKTHFNSVGDNFHIVRVDSPVSEKKALDIELEFDFLIDNKEELDDLYRQLDLILSEIQ